MTRQKSFAGLLAIAMALVFLPGAATRSDTPIVSVSLPALHMSANERVVGFHLQVTSGRIAQIPDVPIGWNLAVENDPSWKTKVDASIIVAAAAADASFFNNFVVLEKDKTSSSPFKVEGEVIVSSDFSTHRSIRVGMKDFAMKQGTR